MELLNGCRRKDTLCILEEQVTKSVGERCRRTERLAHQMLVRIARALALLHQGGFFFFLYLYFDFRGIKEVCINLEGKANSLM